MQESDARKTYFWIFSVNCESAIFSVNFGVNMRFSVWTRDFGAPYNGPVSIGWIVTTGVHHGGWYDRKSPKSLDSLSTKRYLQRKLNAIEIWAND